MGPGGVGWQLESIVGVLVGMAVTPLYDDVVEFLEARGFALIAAFPVTRKGTRATTV